MKRICHEEINNAQDSDSVLVLRLTCNCQQEILTQPNTRQFYRLQNRKEKICITIFYHKYYWDNITYF